MTKMIKQKLKIDGMHCTSCAMGIDMDLEDLEGVKSARTSYVKEETAVEFNEEKIDTNKIIEIIKKTGYSAKPLDE